jgi:hypothetical protein
VDFASRLSHKQLNKCSELDFSKAKNSSTKKVNEHDHAHEKIDFRANSEKKSPSKFAAEKDFFTKN